MSWANIDRQIEYSALAWREEAARMARAAMRAVDDILYPERAAKRRLIRAELLARARWQDQVNRIAAKLREARES